MNGKSAYMYIFCSPALPKKRQAKEEIEFEETPQEKKLRLAKLYLDQLKEEGRLVYFMSVTCGLSEFKVS